MKTLFLTLTVLFTAAATAVPPANHNTTRSNRTNGIAVPNGGGGAVPNDKELKKSGGTPDLNLHCAGIKDSTKKASCKAKADAEYSLQENKKV